MHKLPALLTSLALLTLTLPAIAANDDKAKTREAKEGTSEEAEKPIPEAKVWVTRHTIKMNGATLAYTATAGTMLIKDERTSRSPCSVSRPTSKDGTNLGTRPIMFAYNGGPGSASAGCTWASWAPSAR